MKLLGNEVFVFYMDDIVDLIIDVESVKINFFNNIDYSNFDIVHTCCLRPDINRWMFKLIGNKAKTVSSVHCDTDVELKLDYGIIVSKLISPFWKKAISTANAIIVSSENMKEKYSSSFASEKIAVIPYGRGFAPNDIFVSDFDIEKILQIKSRYKVIGTIASLTKRKGTEQVLKYLATNSEYALISLGVGPEYESLMDLVKIYSLENRVIFLGFRPDSRIYYQFFDIFCLPSRSEGFPLVVIDAMCARIPMLLSNLPQYFDYLSSEDAAFFDLDNIDSFGDAVSRIEILGDSLSKNALLKYEKYFSLEKYAESTLLVYLSLL
jgi:glycosyltransferase involved in cell wall biosynthesis